MTGEEITKPAAPAEDLAATPAAGLEVVEFEGEAGEAEWADSVFVRDFTDSILETKPSQLR
jgi:hypothetical protein